MTRIQTKGQSAICQGWTWVILSLIEKCVLFLKEEEENKQFYRVKVVIICYSTNVTSESPMKS